MLSVWGGVEAIFFYSPLKNSSATLTPITGYSLRCWRLESALWREDSYGLPFEPHALCMATPDLALLCERTSGELRFYHLSLKSTVLAQVRTVPLAENLRFHRQMRLTEDGRVMMTWYSMLKGGVVVIPIGDTTDSAHTLPNHPQVPCKEPPPPSIPAARLGHDALE